MKCKILGTTKQYRAVFSWTEAATNLVYFQYTSRLPILSTFAVLISSNASIQQCIALSSNSPIITTTNNHLISQRGTKLSFWAENNEKKYANKPNSASIWFRNKTLNSSYLCTTANPTSRSNGNLSPACHCCLQKLS